MKKLFLSLTVLILLSSYSKTVVSQTTSQLKIIDFSVMEDFPVDATSINEDSKTLIVSFKIQDTNVAQSLHIDFGTTQFSSDVLTKLGTFSGSEIMLDGINYTVTNYQVQLNVIISQQQYESTHYISLYVTDRHGDNTEKLEFVK